MVALLELLDRHNIQYDKEELIKRYDLFMKGLRRDPDFEEELKEFKKQKGGAPPLMAIFKNVPPKRAEGDFLGPSIRWIVDVLGSPYAQTFVRILFVVLFFASYLENIPGFGSILSVALDLTVLASKSIIKNVQKGLHAMIGAMPFPFSGIVGMVFASIFGMFVWPLVALLAFSRQDFTVAIESFIRIIPPPFGDGIADTFLDANRAVAKMNDKRIQLVKDISEGIDSLVRLSETANAQIKDTVKYVNTTVKDNAKEVGSQIKEGAKSFIVETKQLLDKPSPYAPAAAAAAASSLTSKVPSLPSTEKLPTLPTPEFLKRTPEKPEMDMEPTKLPRTTVRRKSFGGKRLSKKKTRKGKWQKK